MQTKMAPAAHTTTRHLSAGAAQAEMSRATLTVSRPETYCMDCTWASTISALVNDVLIDGPVQATLYAAPEGTSDRGSKWRAVTGTLDYGPSGQDLIFQDGAMFDTAEYIGFVVSL